MSKTSQTNPALGENEFGMKRSTPLSVCDSLTIQCVRFLEEIRVKEPERVANLEIERDENGRISDPNNLLLLRAKRLIPQYSLSERTIRNIPIFLFSIGIVLILFFGGLLLPLGKALNILGGNTVNLAGAFFWFLLLQFFFLGLSFLFLTFSFIILVVRLLFCYLTGRRRKQTLDSGWFYVWGSFFGRIIVHGLQGVLRHIPFHTVVKRDPDTIRNTSEGLSHFTDYLVQRKKPFFYLSGFYSHFFWLTMSISILICLVIQMQSNEYRYRWETSLSDINDAQKIVFTLALPFPSFLQPDEKDIQSLFDRNVAGEQKDGAEASRNRKEWSWFVLACILTYCVFPRGILTLIYYLLFRSSLKDFNPDLSEPYFEKILNKLEMESSSLHSEKLMNEMDRSLKEAPSAPAFLEQEGREKTSEIQALPQESAPKKERIRTLILGYDAELDDAFWSNLLGQATPFDNFGNVVGQAGRKEAFRDWLLSHHEEVCRTIILLDSSFSPSGQQILFFEKLVRDLVPSTFFFILSGGERLRRKFNGAAIPISERLTDWNRCLETVSHSFSATYTIVTCFDHYLNLPDPRAQLGLILNGKTLDEQTSSLENSSKKFEQATERILQSCRDLLSVSPPSLPQDEESAELTGMTKLYEELSEIYRDESRSLWQTCYDAVKIRSPEISDDQELRDKIRALYPQLTDPDLLKERLLPSIVMMEKAKQFCSRLSPRCAIATAALGAALPLTVACAPLIGGTLSIGAVASVIGSLGTLLPSTLVAGGTGALIGSLLPISASAVRERMKSEWKRLMSGTEDPDNNHSEPLNSQARNLLPSLVCVGATWTLIFELQGKPEDWIAARLSELIEPLESSPLDSLEEVQETLKQLQSRLITLKSKDT